MKTVNLSSLEKGTLAGKEEGPVKPARLPAQALVRLTRVFAMTSGYA